ncbi:MAG: hypothetical protein HYZ51_04605 [Candidatus Doudnabacteria bacterium]|nr:hypothetical protein [Candidatus Doudnabacteria bacterium]
MTKEEALENLIETLLEYEINFDLTWLSKKELEILFHEFYKEVQRSKRISKIRAWHNTDVTPR